MCKKDRCKTWKIKTKSKIPLFEKENKICYNLLHCVTNRYTMLHIVLNCYILLHFIVNCYNHCHYLLHYFVTFIYVTLYFNNVVITIYSNKKYRSDLWKFPCHQYKTFARKYVCHVAINQSCGCHVTCYVITNY